MITASASKRQQQSVLTTYNTHMLPYAQTESRCHTRTQTHPARMSAAHTLSHTHSLTHSVVVYCCRCGHVVAMSTRIEAISATVHRTACTKHTHARTPAHTVLAVVWCCVMCTDSVDHHDQRLNSQQQQYHHRSSTLAASP